MNNYKKIKLTSINLIFFCLILGTGLISCQGGKARVKKVNVIDYVNLFTCTSGDHGQLDPSATVPFGMVKLGPDTDPINHSGYNYKARKIQGFSHNRIGGVGCNGAGGNLRILPVPNINKTGAEDELFIKESEKATPDYYFVIFENNIKAELTAINQCGFHRYTYPESNSSGIIMDLNSSFGGIISSSHKIINSRELSAQISAKNVCGVGRYTVNYHIWSNKNLNLCKEKDGKLYFSFKTQNREEVILKVTTSTISSDDARKEFKAVTNNISFDQAREEGEKKWNNLLSKIIVEGNKEYKTIFYTHMYHIFLNPVITSNRNNEFRATNGEIYKSSNNNHYACWSMWDSFRNKFSLYPIILPKVSEGIAQSLADLYKYGKPYWSGYKESVPTVRTEHSIITLLDFYRKGITDFDVKTVYQKMSAEITNIYEGSPDTKLEKSYDYWALAQFAKELNLNKDYNLYMHMAEDYKGIWRKKFLHMDEKSDIMHGDGLYEGTLWQYRWHAHFDVKGMIEMMGGKKNYCKELEYFFDHNLYNHGNQPDIHAPFMFNFGDKPWLTQKWVNKILTKDMYQFYGTHNKWEKPYYGHIYKNDPEGYILGMDDDEGTMSGWYVFAAMGLYPVAPGIPDYQLSTPIFDKITFNLSKNKSFVIETKGFSDKNIYIQSATLNGIPYNKSYINYKNIIKGGKLVFQVSDTPNMEWGTEK